MIEWQVTVLGWEITISVWACFAAVFDLDFYRCRYLDPMPRLGWPGAKIDMAHADVYTPVFGIGIEVWRY